MKDDDNLFVVQVLGWWVVQGEQPGPAGHQGGHTQSASQAAQPITHQLLNVSWDFWASEFETICVPDKQAKILSNSISISPRCLITKLRKFNSAMCMTLQSQNFRLSKSKHFTSNLFFHVICVHNQPSPTISSLSVWKQSETNKDFVSTP